MPLASAMFASATHILDLVLVHRRHLVDYDPRQTPPKVYDLMHTKTEDTRGENVVANVCIPRGP